MNNFFNFNLKEMFEYISEVQSGKRKYRVIDLKIIEDKSINLDFHIYTLNDGSISNTIGENARFKTREEAEEYVIWKAHNNIGIWETDYVIEHLKKINGYDKRKREIIQQTADHEIAILKIAIDGVNERKELFEKKIKKLEEERKYL